VYMAEDCAKEVQPEAGYLGEAREMRSSLGPETSGNRPSVGQAAKCDPAMCQRARDYRELANGPTRTETSARDRDDGDGLGEQETETMVTDWENNRDET
jgi:hypothetical protein